MPNKFHHIILLIQKASVKELVIQRCPTVLSYQVGSIEEFHHSRPTILSTPRW